MQKCQTAFCLITLSVDIPLLHDSALLTTKFSEQNREEGTLHFISSILYCAQCKYNYLGQVVLPSPFCSEKGEGRCPKDGWVRQKAAKAYVSNTNGLLTCDYF